MFFTGLMKNSLNTTGFLNIDNWDVNLVNFDNR